jgi:hypothetical protein
MFKLWFGFQNPFEIIQIQQLKYKIFLPIPFSNPVENFDCSRPILSFLFADASGPLGLYRSSNHPGLADAVAHTIHSLPACPNL